MSNSRNTAPLTAVENLADIPPFTWDTPLHHEPALIDQLRRANQELQETFTAALDAHRDGDFTAASSAFERCRRQLHEIQRTEALRLYPPIAYQLARDSRFAAVITRLRQQTNGLARQFLLLAENLFASDDAPAVSAIAEAEAILNRYLSNKELRLYQFYTLTTPINTELA